MTWSLKKKWNRTGPKQNGRKALPAFLRRPFSSLAGHTQCREEPKVVAYFSEFSQNLLASVWTALAGQKTHCRTHIVATVIKKAPESPVKAVHPPNNKYDTCVEAPERVH